MIKTVGYMALAGLYLPGDAIENRIPRLEVEMLQYKSLRNSQHKDWQACIQNEVSGHKQWQHAWTLERKYGSDDEYEERLEVNQQRTWTQEDFDVRSFSGCAFDHCRLGIRDVCRIDRKQGGWPYSWLSSDVCLWKSRSVPQCSQPLSGAQGCLGVGGCKN
jgi:hypothetical protein